jgi:aspartate racemase
MDRGMKSLTFNQVHAHSLLCVVMDQLLQEGCDALLLGCTEIPLAIPETEYKGVPVLNASWMMAHELVRRADPRKLKPFK